MLKALIGSGGSAREIKAHMISPRIPIMPIMPCFVDDDYWHPNDSNIFPLSEFDPEEYEVIISNGSPRDKFNIKQRLPKNTKYFTYIHPTALLLGPNLKIGHGCFIGANCILTCDIEIGNHVLLNRGVQIGHDCLVGSYCSLMPGVILSGNCLLGDSVYIGTNSAIREKISITTLTTIGMGSTVIDNIIIPGTYVGSPARRIFK